MTYDPQLYRLLHRGQPGDVAFYRARCEGANSVLELGCGWGRVLREVASGAGLCVGLDVNAAFLAMARAALPPEVGLVRADLRLFAFRRPFARVIAPYGSLYNVPPEGQRAAMRCLRDALAPDGRFSFDVWHADAFHDDSRPDDLADDELVPVVSVEHRGKLWDVFECSVWDRAAQRVDSRYVYVARDGSHTVEGRITHHYLLSHQLAELLHGAGLELEEIHGDFVGSPLAADSEYVVVTGRRRP